MSAEITTASIRIGLSTLDGTIKGRFETMNCLIFVEKTHGCFDFFMANKGKITRWRSEAAKNFMVLNVLDLLIQGKWTTSTIQKCN